jgi:hypothetical protein
MGPHLAGEAVEMKARIGDHVGRRTTWVSLVPLWHPSVSSRGQWAEDEREGSVRHCWREADQSGVHCTEKRRRCLLFGCDIMWPEMRSWH